MSKDRVRADTLRNSKPVVSHGNLKIARPRKILGVNVRKGGPKRKT